MIWLPIFLTTVLSFSLPSVGGQLSLTGQTIQGGLIFGWATPGARILLNNQSIPQAKSGDFLLGFSYNARASAQLVVTFVDGSIEKRSFLIQQRDYDIQRIDQLPKRKVTPSTTELVLIKSERKLMTKANLRTVKEPFFIEGFTRPILGRISGIFGSQRILNGKRRRPHFGVDIAVPEGSAVKATSSGVVIFTHEGMFFNGKTVVISHGLGLRSTYIHMSTILVKPNMRVSRGDIIGKVGKTGRATGPHLHWAIHLNATPLDPELLFR